MKLKEQIAFTRTDVQEETLTIIIPYRDRPSHKTQFLKHTTKLLELAQIPYNILIVEQYRYKAFNRGKLLNIGFNEAPTSDYYIFHDIDMLMGQGSYEFREGVTHLATKAHQFNFKLPYPEYFGGVTMFDYKSFVKINGFPNDYWGWGAEDDNLRARCILEGLSIQSADNIFGSLFHERFVDDNLYVENIRKLNIETENYKENGLSTLDYKVIDISSTNYPNVKIITVSI